MNQTLHIFKKDTRRFWIEIVVSLLLLVLFVVHSPAHWHINERNQQNALQIITVLLLAIWWLLVGRLIHAESLVGDRQVWLTRPYVWQKLLAANPPLVVP